MKTIAIIMRVLRAVGLALAAAVLMEVAFLVTGIGFLGGALVSFATAVAVYFMAYALPGARPWRFGAMLVAMVLMNFFGPSDVNTEMAVQIDPSALGAARLPYEFAVTAARAAGPQAVCVAAEPQLRQVTSFKEGLIEQHLSVIYVSFAKSTANTVTCNYRFFYQGAFLDAVDWRYSN